MLRDVLQKAAAFELLTIIIFLAGCQQQAVLPSPDVTDSATTSLYPAVVEVILPGGTALCSGTFISPNTVLTASHCAPTSGTYTVLAAWGTFTTSVKINFGPGTVTDPNDMALLVFSQSVASVSQGQVLGVSSLVNAGDILRLVGYGCDNIVSKVGAGIKRTGTNVLSSIDSYLEFVTPSGDWSQAILGPDNRAGSCFGDSGGPSLATDTSGNVTVAGIAHAGGNEGAQLDSEYVNITESDNRAWLNQANTTYDLNVVGL
jgi:hypothetical protein